MNRLFWRLHQIDPARQEPKKLQFAVRRQALTEYLREQPGLQAELAGEEVADLCRFSENIDALTARIVRRVNDLGSTLPTLPGCAELTAAKLISEAANVDRFPNESAFARYAGLAPIPEWSGSTNGRLRVCRSGSRQINTAIHRIAVVQLRLDCVGRLYYQRRRAAGDSGATAVRCLKRRLGRVVFNRLRDDYARRVSPTS
jgi:transposase